MVYGVRALSGLMPGFVLGSGYTRPVSFAKGPRWFAMGMCKILYLLWRPLSSGTKFCTPLPACGPFRAAGRCL